MNEKGGYFLNSGTLFLIAKNAYQLTESALSDKANNQNDALTALLFSAATLEAFINEFAIFASMGAELFPSTSLPQSLAQVLSEAETSRGSVRLKYLLTKTVLSGVPYDKGAHPYQDFDLLFTIRDAIVHMKPEKIREEPHKIISKLSARGLCEKEKPYEKSSWIGQITTRAVARWACNVVRDMVSSIRDCLPESSEGEVNAFGLMKFHTMSFDGVD